MHSLCEYKLKCSYHMRDKGVSGHSGSKFSKLPYYLFPLPYYCITDDGLAADFIGMCNDDLVYNDLDSIFYQKAMKNQHTKLF